jgi:hypothetical protein
MRTTLLFFGLLSTLLSWAAPQGARLSLGSSGLRFQPSDRIQLQGACTFRRKGTIDCIRGEFGESALRAQSQALSSQEAQLSVRALCARSVKGIERAEIFDLKFGNRKLCRASAPGVEIYFEKHKLFWISISIQGKTLLKSEEIATLQNWIGQSRYE